MYISFDLDGTLTIDDKKQALNAINLIKEKKDGSIEKRTCADKSKQHLYLKINKSGIFYSLFRGSAGLTSN